MLLTISTTHRPATDLGFLLHKHPQRVQAFPLPFGTAHVLYPEVGEERCTAALVLDVDPVGLVRRDGHGSFPLAEYVNDRPYVASSLLSVALVNVFKSAMDGSKPELAASALPRRRCRRCAGARSSCGSCSSRSATRSRSGRWEPGT
jgi:hypothetical protein